MEVLRKPQVSVNLVCIRVETSRIRSNSAKSTAKLCYINVDVMGDKDATKGRVETALLAMQGSGNGSVACSARYM